MSTEFYFTTAMLAEVLILILLAMWIYNDLVYKYKGETITISCLMFCQITLICAMLIYKAY